MDRCVEETGQKLRIRVFENKNSNILVYQGHVIKNVSVGSFVKIPKGFSNIIGRIEGEYIQENKSTGENNCQPRFSKESETIDRIIEVSIMGVLNDGRFQRGLINIPLVFSDAYMPVSYTHLFGKAIAAGGLSGSIPKSCASFCAAS